jgi:DNA-binding transcriptional LysR family regulator
MDYAPARRHVRLVDGNDTLDVFMGGAMDLLSGMRLFVRLAEIGGFSVIAREHRISQPTVSRTIAALEAYLGARLPIHTVYPSRRLLATKVRAIIDFLAAEFAGVGRLPIG